LPDIAVLHSDIKDEDTQLTRHDQLIHKLWLHYLIDVANFFVHHSLD
jgi:hypothetical protein